MKKIAIFFMAVMLITAVTAQNVEETTVQLGELTVPAFTVSVPQNEKMVQDAMKQRLKEANLKTEKSNGYIVSINQVFNELSSVPVNFYYKIEDQGRRADHTTLITVLAMTSNTGADEPSLKGNLNRFLGNFVQYVARTEAQTQLASEEKALKKAQKEYDAATKNLEKAEKEITSNEGKIADKKKDIEKLTSKIEGFQGDISKLEDANAKMADKKAKYETAASEALSNLKEVEANVEKYKAILQ